MNYQDPVIAKYIELLKAHAGGAIREFYQGEPVRIPSSSFPCALISKRETRVGPVSNAADQHEMALSITVIADVRSDLSTESGAKNAVAGIAALYDLMEGRNADYTLKETSVLGILRSNLEVDAGLNLRTDLGSVTLVDYGTTLRDRAQEQWSIEARVDYVAVLQQARV
jgi:hypothetical protein